jgi:hypothetical protein
MGLQDSKCGPIDTAKPRSPHLQLAMANNVETLDCYLEMLELSWRGCSLPLQHNPNALTVEEVDWLAPSACCMSAGISQVVSPVPAL